MTDSDISTGSVKSLPDILTITCFVATSLCNVAELNFITFGTFRSRWGLYFWSFLVSAWGIASCSIGFLLKDLPVTTPKRPLLSTPSSPPESESTAARADHDYRQRHHLPHPDYSHGVWCQLKQPYPLSVTILYLRKSPSHYLLHPGTYHLGLVHRENGSTLTTRGQHQRQYVPLGHDASHLCRCHYRLTRHYDPRPRVLRPLRHPDRLQGICVQP